MKKIVINISETTFEKLRFEAILHEKSIQKVIEDRLLEKPFHIDVEEAYSDLVTAELNKILNEPI